MLISFKNKNKFLNASLVKNIQNQILCNVQFSCKLRCYRLLNVFTLGIQTKTSVILQYTYFLKCILIKARVVKMLILTIVIQQ